MYKIPEMNGLLQMTLLDEIVLQSKIAISAFERLNKATKSFDEIEIWGAIQSILVSSGNLSKILWPTKNYRERGKLLREYLNIDNNHILSSRKFRNYFEHFDEYVEERFNNAPTGVYIDRQMNPSLNNIFGDREPICQRGYNVSDHTLIFDTKIFKGKKLDIKTIDDNKLDIKEIIISIENLLKYIKDNKLVLVR